MAARKTTASGPIEVPEFRRRRAEVRIVGDTPLITHRFGPIAMEKMAEAQSGAVKTKRPPRKPEEEYEDAKYLLPDGRCGFRAAAIKCAMAAGAYRLGGLKDMVSTHCAIRIPAELIPIECEAGPQMGCDMVRLASGVASLAYRPYFHEWSAIIPVLYNEITTPLDLVIAMLQWGGNIGIGDWRPERKGIHGTFSVDEGNVTVYG